MPQVLHGLLIGKLEPELEMGWAQWVNVNGVALAVRVLLRDRWAVVPHIRVSTIAAVDWTALQRSGISAVVFDKDNTLTAPYANQLHPDLESAVRQCVSVFGSSAIIFSNHAGSGDDKGHAAALALEREIQLPVLRHTSRKPNGLDSVTAHLKADPREIAVVGDRLLTDVAFANLHGMLSIYTTPLAASKDNAAVKIARWFEERILTRYFCVGVAPPLHPSESLYNASINDSKSSSNSSDSD